MNVICPKCKESYSIKIDLFLDKKQQLQCIRCGHNWEENFFKEAAEKEEKFENLLSKKGERKLTSKQVLKILKEEAEFDKKFKKVSLSRKNHKKTNNNSELKDKELSFMELFGSKEFWFGFSISVAAAVISCIIYLYAETLIMQFPYFNNYIGPFVDFVDSTRNWIDGQKKEFFYFIRNRFL